VSVLSGAAGTVRDPVADLRSARGARFHRFFCIIALYLTPLSFHYFRRSPCIVMKKADAIGLDIDTSFNEEMRDVVLLIAFHDKEKWKVVPKSLLFLSDSGYKRKKKVDSNSNDKVAVWNERFCKRFQKQRQAENPWCTMNKDTNLSDSNDGPDINFNEKSSEHIQPGDVITYWSHL